jgi:pectate lyase
MNEKIKRGDIRKVVITIRSIEMAKTIILDELYYRIYILEGRTQINIHDWTLIDKTNNENSFHFDTSFYIPREYHIEFKGKTHTEEIQYKEPIHFEIVSEK